MIAFKSYRKLVETYFNVKEFLMNIILNFEYYKLRCYYILRGLENFKSLKEKIVNLTSSTLF